MFSSLRRICCSRGMAIVTGRIGANGTEYIVPNGTKEAYERDGYVRVHMLCSLFVLPL
jgi:hypothetical protein